MAEMFDFENPEIQINLDMPTANSDEYNEVAWGIERYGEPIKKLNIPRHKVSDDDIKLQIEYCGVCRSDLMAGCNEAPGMYSKYPCIPGHELVGTIVEVGGNVEDFKVGDKAGIGTYVDSCFNCPMCADDQDHYCFKGPTLTYSGDKIHGRVGGNKEIHTFGGYSGSYVCHKRFVFKLYDGMPIEKAGPLLCAGITMYDPLWRNGALDKANMKIGIAGVGGLGTMGIKLAVAMGHTVTAISSSNRKKEMAMQKGASKFVATSVPDSMADNMGTLDLILDTIPVHHDIQGILRLLAPYGTLVLIGMQPKPYELGFLDLVISKKITCSGVGGVESTKRMLEFCAKNNVYPDIEVITADKLNETWAKLQKGSNASSLRYVLDVTNSKRDC